MGIQDQHDTTDGTKDGQTYMPSAAVTRMEAQNLTELIDAEFNNKANDKDNSLEFPQLVKVCKILLHKINYNARRLTESDY